MSKLTDVAIKAALKEVGRTGKAKRLSDGTGKGTGRVVLSIKPSGDSVSAEWFAQQWADGKRTMAKMGNYPSMTLSVARDRFTSDHAGRIHAGDAIKASKAGSLADLKAAYLSALSERGTKTVENITYLIDKAVAEIGESKQARDVTYDDAIRYLSSVYGRGAIHVADRTRIYLRAMFEWGIKSERDYRATVKRRFMIEANPIIGIPAEPVSVGDRFLSPEEFSVVYRHFTNRRHRYALAIRISMLTGQRPTQILSTRMEHIDRANMIITWPTSKLGTPHTIPITPMMLELFELAEKSSSNGWVFPDLAGTAQASQMELSAYFYKNKLKIQLPNFSMRDLRRTWKTLAGHAGLTKTERDLIQHHSVGDASSRHYDRYHYLAEKRVGMEKWEEWIKPRL